MVKTRKHGANTPSHVQRYGRCGKGSVGTAVVCRQERYDIGPARIFAGKLYRTVDRIRSRESVSDLFLKVARGDE